MSLRKTILATGEIYHIFNHSVAHLPIFKGNKECNLFIETIKYYLQPKPPVRFSIYRQCRLTYPIDLKDQLVSLLNYCIMPNHFHITLRQEMENGIKQFMQKLLCSFAHYYCLKNKSRGHVFESNFKAVRIETTEQLIHLSRYIHLNPVTSYIVKKPEDYPHSSYKVYLGKEKSDFIEPSQILSNFPSNKQYEEFVLSEIDYQHTLAKIKHLLLE